LCLARAAQATDIHLSVDRPIVFKVAGKFLPQTAFAITADFAQRMLVDALLTHEQQLVFNRRGDYELVHVIDGLGRFRVTMLKKTPGIDVTVRLICQRLPAFAESGLPEACRELMHWSQGMVLAGRLRQNNVAGDVGRADQSVPRRAYYQH